MLLSKAIKSPRELIDQYRKDLLRGLEFAAKDEETLYRLHLKGLADLETLLGEGNSIEKLSSLLRSARHSHGWSFLSGKEGERVSNSAHALFTDLENQIFDIKGMDWYYADENR